MANLSNINGKFVVEQTTGFVGIGTTDPDYLLHVNSSDIPNGTRLIIQNTNGSGKKYGLISDNTGVFTVRDVTAGADRFSISNLGDATFAGNVNIGPDALDIQLKAASNNSGKNLIYLRGNASGDKAEISLNHFGYANMFIGMGTTANTVMSLTATSGGTDGIIIDSSGNVGIGITPNVNSSVVNVIQLGKGMTLLGNANDDRATMAANLYLDTGTAFRYVMDGLAGRFSIEDGNMVWGTASSGTAGTVATVYTKMTLLNNGNVGIGANSPAEKLHVSAGNIRLDSTVAGGNGILIIYDSSGTQSGQIYGSSGDLKIYSPADVLFNQGGNIGIGTDSPGSILDVVDTSGTTTLTLGRSNEIPEIKAGGTNTDLRLSAVGPGGFLDFQTNGDSRMRIKSGGNVNIGSGSLGQTAYQLRVDSDFNNGIYLSAGTSSSDHAIYTENLDASAELFLVRGDGNIKIPQIGVTAGATAIGVDGSGFIRKLSSSKRYKKDIELIDIGLDFIDSLSPVKFKMKEDDVESVGLIAEDMIDNRFVTYSQIDMKDKSKGLQVEGVNYQALIAPLIKSIQELKADNDTLKARIETLENK